MIQVNGKNREFAGSTVEDLLRELQLADKNVVVEKNRAIVHRDTYAEERIGQGDVIELVRFVGGG